jgi:D-3-phosphoglycerate dehydrogenase
VKVLFIDSVHPILWERLTENKFTCVDATSKSADQILLIIDEFEGVVIRSKFTFNEPVFEKAKKLKFIARSGSGLENIDLDSADKNNVTVFNSPEGNRDALAEHGLGMLLSLFNNLNRGHSEVLNSRWNREKNRGVELKGKTVSLIGYGLMGNAIAERLSGFGCKVLAYDKYKTNYSNQFAKEADYATIFEHTEVLSFHVPLNESSLFMCDENYLAQFKKPIYVVNTSRGKVVNTEHLINAMKMKKVLGCCLDVLEYESASFENLDPKLEKALAFFRTQNNVVLSPHVAGWTTESYYKLSDYLASKILGKFTS